MQRFLRHYEPMVARLKSSVVRRPSLPLTEQDERDLLLLRHDPAYRKALAGLSGEGVESAETSEAALLHAVLAAGLNAVRLAAEAEGYAAIAAQQAIETPQRRAAARRRRPSWANEA